MKEISNHVDNKSDKCVTSCLSKILPIVVGQLNLVPIKSTIQTMAAIKKTNLGKKRATF
jgi:hypothetical protein